MARCGRAAQRKLQELIGKDTVCCQRAQASTTRGRVVMRCVLGEKDVGQEMVRAGLAFDQLSKPLSAPVNS